MNYDDALADCSSREGESLVSVENVENAIDALQSSPLAEGIRLNAVSNEVCFQDQDGERVDLESRGFNMELPEPEGVYGLSANADSGDISMAAVDAVLATVCQINLGDGGSGSSNIIPNVRKFETYLTHPSISQAAIVSD